MDLAEFQNLLDRARSAHPGWFMLPADSPATEGQLAHAEAALGVLLPSPYRWFLSVCGGGDFAFTNVFSVDPASDWNIVNRNRGAGLIGGDFVGISDDEAGGLYVLRAINGACQTGVHYLDLTTREVTDLVHDDILSYIASAALRHQA